MSISQQATGIDSFTQPREGDLIYMTMTQRLFEIKYVEPKSPFYQLQNLPTYTLTAELFEYNDQHFDTGCDEIDAIEWKNATSYSYIVGSTLQHTSLVKRSHSGLELMIASQPYQLM